VSVVEIMCPYCWYRFEREQPKHGEMFGCDNCGSLLQADTEPVHPALMATRIQRIGNVRPSPEAGQAPGLRGTA
jgi:ABC-type ATPase with predicted acetyltransferase domain